MPSHILIVDDDSSIRETIAEVLAEEGYVVKVATNGAEALAAIERDPPALVLLDMRMPVLDGWAVARALAERGPAPPLIVMSAARESDNWSQEIAAAAVLTKPFDLNDLLAAVEWALHNARPA